MFNLSDDVTTWYDFMNHYGIACGKKPKGLPLFMTHLLAFVNKIPGITTPIDSGFIEMATSKKYFPTDKAFNMLGWKPKVSLGEGMQITIQWLKNEIKSA